MGIVSSKDFRRRKIDEATSNSSLSNLRYFYATPDKSKWNVFRRKEVPPISTYRTSLKPVKGCPCGSNGPCKQKVTPNGVTIHYPNKKKKSFSKRYKPTINQTLIDKKWNEPTKMKFPKKFFSWRVDKIHLDNNYFRYVV